MCSVSLNRNFYRVLGSKLSLSEGYEGQTEIEEKVAIGENGKLSGYVELKKKVKLGTDYKHLSTLSDFGVFFPELLKSGMAPETELTAHTLHSYRVYPGRVRLTKKITALIDLEVCTREAGGVPFVVGCSFTIDTPNYYRMRKAHSRAEEFLTRVIGGPEDGEDGWLAFPDEGKWLGSKLLVMLGLPSD